MNSGRVRSLICKLEVAVGVLLVLAVVANLSWCEWSLPRHGVRTSHGLETSVCNWGTSLLVIVLGVIAVLTLVSGLIGRRVQSRTVYWYAAQLPAIAAWGWVASSIIYSAFVYPG